MTGVSRKTQLTLDFDAGLSDRFSSVRELVLYKVITSPKKQAYIAAELDMSPSDLSRKLAKNPNDNKRSFSTDDLEKYMDTQGDNDPALYYVERYLAKASRAELERQLLEIQKKLGV